MNNYYFSNEIVFRGHPDKVCDQISAKLLTEYVKGDKNTRAGIEVVGGKGKIFITGEVTSKAHVDVEKVTKEVLADIGYSTDYEIINNIGLQSDDIAMGVDVGGAGDQGMMFGYAVNDTPEMLPTAMVILQRLSKAYYNLTKLDNSFLPDGKAQITGLYDENGKLLIIKDFTISYQNTELDRPRTDGLLRALAIDIADEYGIFIENFHINPTGKFLIGGFDGDAGLTGRKIVVDAYQSFANVGGGCQNGKDATKVDFSASHKAREIAKRILKETNAHDCEVQISYAIGLARPLAIYVKVDGENYELPYDCMNNLYDECTPSRIINDLGLLDVDYYKLAQYGHYVD